LRGIQAHAAVAQLAQLEPALGGRIGRYDNIGLSLEQADGLNVGNQLELDVRIEPMQLCDMVGDEARPKRLRGGHAHQSGRLDELAVQTLADLQNLRLDPLGMRHHQQSVRAQLDSGRRAIEHLGIQRLLQVVDPARNSGMINVELLRGHAESPCARNSQKHA
jgi:hypothetical protein